MIIVGGGWKIWLLGLAVSVGIFAVLYFTVIKPTTDTANEAVRNSFQQSNDAIQEAKQDAPPGARRQLDQAEKLTACLQDAGIDTGAIQDCQARFGP